MKKSLCCISILLALLMAVSAFSVMQVYAANTSKAVVADDDEGYFGYLEKTSVSLKAGAVKAIDFLSSEETPLYRGKAWSENAKIAKVSIEEDKDNCNNYLNIYALKKGTTTIKCKDSRGNISTCKVKVTTNPSIKVGGKAFKSSKRYPIKKGKTLAVKITGKSPIVKNAYSSSKKSVAKVISKTTAKTAKIKGFKAGKATVTIKVNGVAFKVKVKVK